MPREVHEHFDAEGNLTGTTVVTRESAWDDSARGRALRLDEYESSLCPCCNMPRSIAHDNEQVFVVDDYTCYAGRALKKVQRMKNDEAEKQKRPEGWNDGVNYYVRPHDPDRDKPLNPPKPRGVRG